jgi:NO-binding membrane sensor protein with MHYT domain
MDGFNATQLEELAVYYQTHPLPVHYSPVFIALSILVSLIGCYATLLLLGRRTSNHGHRNFLYLIAAAFLMASGKPLFTLSPIPAHEKPAGIFGMHFVGMFHSLRPAPGVHWYIKFSPGFTVLSLLVPLATLCICFLLLGGQSEVHYARCLVAGIVLGLIVSFMHFSAAFDASFRPEYLVGHAVGAVVIACVAAPCALAIFFKFRDQWQDRWFKRTLCAAFLASAVCGMH